MTLPAHVTLFTGLYPEETGLVTNGRGRLDDSIGTLARVVRRRGYETGAFIASYVLQRKFGLEGGFQVYDDDFAGDDPHLMAGSRRRAGQEVVDAALKWLAQPHRAPFFCWVHLYDPHAPYLGHSDLFGDEFANRPYDAEIAYVDRQVERLVEFLKTSGRQKNTLVVVVADHGEGLGEHLELTHGELLYNSTMRVPLIFSQPGRLPAGRRIAANVSMVDVYPTILDLLGQPESKSLLGRSIRRAMTGGAIESSPCYGATDQPYISNGWAPLQCLLDGSWKYIQTTRAELYDLTTDPHELHNLAEAEPGRAQAMKRSLDEYRSRMRSHTAAEVQLSHAERRVLESLGYVGAGKRARKAPAAAELPDIKDMLPFNVAVEEALKLKAEGSTNAAIERLKEVVQKAPGHLIAHVTLGVMLTEAARLDEAAEVYRALLSSRPDAPGGHYGLAYVALAQGRVDDAVAEYGKEIEVNPDSADAYFSLAAIEGNRGQTQEALNHLEQVLQIDFGHAGAFVARAALLARLGRKSEAITHYRQALRFAPQDAAAHHGLGLLLGEQGETDEAGDHLRRAALIEPRNAEYQYTLGTFLAGSARYDEAADHLARALELRPGFAAAETKLNAVRRLRSGEKSNAD
jgi:arylsulfatase A-like enzyme/Tfp pilus assembly protein PilF